MTSHSRRFTEDLPRSEHIAGGGQDSHQPLDKESIRKSIIGQDATFVGPFGTKPVVYCDQTASGRSLSSIEDYIRHQVLPLYGNTHSSATVTSEQSTLFLHEARETVRDWVRAGDDHSVIFSGHNATSGANFLAKLVVRFASDSCQCGSQNGRSLVVFHGPFEHHSNLLPWRECASKVVRIRESCETGYVDLQHLESELQADQSSDSDCNCTPLLIGAFSAASNVTGLITDVQRVTRILHRHNALSFWDCATLATYERVTVTGGGDSDLSVDALFFAGHKILGGVSSPGVVVVRKRLFQNLTKPLAASGGGSVFFVNRIGHSYLKEAEFREEAGTPDVIGCVRLALAIRHKEATQHVVNCSGDMAVIRHVLNSWGSNPNLILLGPSAAENRLPIFSFIIRHPESGLYLHHAFVTALLDNLFGIQTRCGCACAGPYALNLLGIDHELSMQFEAALRENESLDRHHLRRKHQYSQYEMLRPGFTRLNFARYLSQPQIDYIINSVLFVAEHGWRFLPQYRLNVESGEWHHINMPVFVHRRWLAGVQFTKMGLSFSRDENPMPDGTNTTLDIESAECLQSLKADAESLVGDCKRRANRIEVVDLSPMFSGNDAVTQLRWFLLAHEAKSCLLNEPLIANHAVPFTPMQFCVTKIEGQTPDKQPSQSKLQPKMDCLPGCSVSSCAGTRQNWHKRTHIVPRNDVDVIRGGKKVWRHPPRSILNAALEAIMSYNMIRNNDKVLVCLSGGKDSLSLLHTLRQVQFVLRSGKLDGEMIGFQLGAITIDPGSTAYDPSPLIDYCTKLNVEYLYEQQDILAQAASLQNCANGANGAVASICAFCSRMKRGRLYAGARANKWNVLAFAHHLDDLAESFVMNALYNGALRTMKAHYTVREGDLRVIRPLIYVRETSLRQFATAAKLPVISENCPACFEAPKERHRTKQLLATVEAQHPGVFHNLKTAMKPLYSRERNSGCEITNFDAMKLSRDGSNDLDEDGS